MSNSHEEFRTNALPSGLALDGQISIIKTMKALRFKSNEQGVCFGLAYSARDEYLTGSFTGFLKHLNEIDDIYNKIKANDATMHTLENEKEIKKISKMISDLSTIIDDLQIECVKIIDEIQDVFARGEELKSEHGVDSKTVADSQSLPEKLNKSKKLTEEIKSVIKEKIELSEKLETLLKYNLEELDDRENIILDKINQVFDVLTDAKIDVIRNIIHDFFFDVDSQDDYLDYEFTDILNSNYQMKEIRVEELINWIISKKPPMKELIAEQLKLKISSIPQEELDFFNKTKAIFTRIDLYQQANNYEVDDMIKLFKKGATSINQTKSLKVVYPFVETEKLEKEGGLETSISFTGCYSLAELKNYFKSLMASFKEIQHSIVLNLENNKHAIMIGYDPINKLFTYFDPNQPLGEFSDESILADKTFSALSAENTLSIISTKVSILKKNHDKTFDIAINDWYKNALQASNEITTDKMNFNISPNLNWFTLAICNGDVESVNNFIKRGINIEYKHFVIAAVNNPNPKVLVSLASNFINPLCSAVENRNLDLVKEFLEVGIDINKIETQGSVPVTALSRAIQIHDVEMVEFLLQNGANPHQRLDDMVSLTPLHEVYSLTNSPEKSLIIELLNKYDLHKQASSASNQLSSTACIFKSGLMNHDVSENLVKNDKQQTKYNPEIMLDKQNDVPKADKTEDKLEQDSSLKFAPSIKFQNK